MSGLPYYKAYPRDFIEGTVGMRFELKGAYRLVLDLIYMHEGGVKDDSRYISGVLGCSVRKWNSLRSELLSLGKLHIIGELLSNYRAVIEVETLTKLQDTKRENRSRPNKNNELEKRPFCMKDHSTEPEERKGEVREERKKEEKRFAAATVTPASPRDPEPNPSRQQQPQQPPQRREPYQQIIDNFDASRAEHYPGNARPFPSPSDELIATRMIGYADQRGIANWRAVEICAAADREIDRKMSAQGRRPADKLSARERYYASKIDLAAGTTTRRVGEPAPAISVEERMRARNATRLTPAQLRRRDELQKIAGCV